MPDLRNIAGNVSVQSAPVLCKTKGLEPPKNIRLDLIDLLCDETLAHVCPLRSVIDLPVCALF